MLNEAVTGTLGEQKFKASIHWRNGVFIADEPEKSGGGDLGPDPQTLLLASLITCTLATLRMYIDHKKMVIPEIKVSANMAQRINAGNGEITTRIDRWISFGDSTPEPAVKERLLEVADRCPISKLLKGNVTISTSLAIG